MNVTIEILSGSNNEEIVTKSKIQKNIDAITRSITGTPQARDFVLLADTKSILECIQRQLK